MATKTRMTEEELTELREKVIELRDGETPLKWSEISTELGIPAGKAMFLHMQAHVRPKDRIKGKTDDELGAAIAAARDEELQSWGQISARAGIGEGKCRTLYLKTTGKPSRGTRIGKGGRYPDGVTPPARPSEARQKVADKTGKTAKPSAKSTAAGPPSKKAKRDYSAMDFDALTEALTGKMVTYKSDEGKQVRVRIKDVADLVGGVVHVEDNDGTAVEIAVGSIVRVAAR